MQLIIDTYENTGNLHHAYCIEGDRATLLPKLYDFLETTFEFPTKANPDFFLKQCETLSIDDSREIKAFHVCKSFGTSGKKVFIIAADFITREAQNALLKVFEEPSPGNHFFIITPTAEILLPTLASRLVVVKNTAENAKSKLAGEFIASSIAGRLAFVKEFVASISDEDTSKIDAVIFLNKIEREYVGKKKVTDLNTKDIVALQEIAKARNYLSDRSASTKMLLEHVALVL